MAEQIEGPGSKGEARAFCASSGETEVVLGQVKKVGGQPFLVHAIEHRIHGSAGLSAATHQHGTIAAVEAQAVDAAGTLDCLAAGDHMEVRVEAVGPIHRTSRDHLLIWAGPGHPGAGQGVDYAVLENGQPKILIEAKPYTTDLKTAEMGQLSRYFQATNARIGILTNGQAFLFFSDLDKPNLMDEKPFAEINLFNLKSAPLKEIKQMSKAMYDIDNLLSIAEELKYKRGVKEQLKAELTDPSEWLVREMAGRVHSAKRTSSQLLEKFKPIVIEAIKEYIEDRIQERLSSAAAMEAEKVQASSATQSSEVSIDNKAIDDGGIITTKDEYEGLYIIRAICASEIDPSRLAEKDTKSYCDVLLDNNSWKSIVRMHFNGPQKKLEIFDDAEPKMVPLESLSAIYQLSERIRSALRLKLS